MTLDKALVLRTCANNMADHCGLIWPASGTVESRYWQSTRRHENGLVGLLWGAGTSAFLSVHADARWIVCEVAVADIISLEEPGMVKFPRAEVVHVGDRISASHFISARQADPASTSTSTSTSTLTPMPTAIPTPMPAVASVTLPVAEQARHEVFDVASVSAAAAPVNTLPVTTPQNLQTATYGSTLSGDNHSRLIAGYGSNETAGNHSDLIAGYGSTGTAGGGHDCTLMAGDQSRLTAGKNSVLTAGARSKLIGSEGSTLSAGEDSTLIFRLWDGKRYRQLVARTGENGVEADIPYYVNEDDDIVDKPDEDDDWIEVKTSQTNPYARGPNPTAASLEASAGPFTVRSFTVSRPSGYGAGTVYYPTNAGGTVGAIAIVPGYTARQSSIKWWGPRLASHGFVVITIDTNSTLDQPSSRSSQQMAALRQVASLNGTSSSPIYGKVDTARMGVMGWSMGGGGSLISAANNPSLKAAAPQAPWDSSTNFSSVTVPTLIFACENDSIAPVNSSALPIYDSMSRNAKQFLEINGGSHSCANSGNSNQALIGKKGVAWMKRFMDNDTRYSTFACENPNSTRVSDFRTANCSKLRDGSQPQGHPVIVLQGDNPLSVPLGSTFNDPGASASDAEDGSLPVSADCSAVNPSVVGSYSCLYSATDSDGNRSTLTRTVEVYDPNAPVETCQVVSASPSAHIGAGRAYAGGTSNLRAYAKDDGVDIGGSFDTWSNVPLYEGEPGRWYAQRPAACGGSGQAFTCQEWNASNLSHVMAGRAYYGYYTVGGNQYLGSLSGLSTWVRETAQGHFQAGRCSNHHHHHH